MHSQPSERLAVVGTVDPQTVANTERFTDVVDMSKWAEACFVALLGDMANETITFTVYESANADGSSGSAISGKQLALSAHASNNDNRQIQINLKAEELSEGKRYVRAGLITGNTTGGPAAVLALGLRPRFGPGSDDDLSSNSIL